MNKESILLVAAACFFALPVPLAMAAGEPPSDGVRSAVVQAAPGQVAWFDITTTNLPQSKEFYGKLFDWTFNSLQGTDQAIEIVSQGKPIGTLRVAEGKIGAFNGVVYVKVEDIQSSCKKAKQLGASIVDGFPFNLPAGKGAIAVAGDPSGHPVGMYSMTPVPAANK